MEENKLINKLYINHLEKITNNRKKEKVFSIKEEIKKTKTN